MGAYIKEGVKEGKDRGRDGDCHREFCGNSCSAEWSVSIV